MHRFVLEGIKRSFDKAVTQHFLEKSFLLKTKKDKQVEILHTVYMCAKDSHFSSTFQMCLFFVCFVFCRFLHCPCSNGLGRKGNCIFDFHFHLQ